MALSRHPLHFASTAGGASLRADARAPGAGMSPASVIALLPPAAGVKWDDYQPILSAADDAVSRAGSSVTVQHYDDIGGDCVQLAGEAVLAFQCRVTTCPLLYLLLADTSNWFAVDVDAEDASGVSHTFHATNKCSTVRVKGAACEMPIVCAPGWCMLPLDIAAMMRAAFAVDLAAVTGVRITATVHVARVFFADRQVTQEDLPEWLHVTDAEL